MRDTLVVFKGADATSCPQHNDLRIVGNSLVLPDKAS